MGWDKSIAFFSLFYRYKIKYQNDSITKKRKKNAMKERRDV
jgi:hypothetical protein